jgi:hypothetical protein
VNVVAAAWPKASVVAVVLAVPFANVPLAAVAGAVNVTVTPETALPLLSVTVACIAVANAVLIVALCGVPAVAEMLAADPAVLVSEKLAAVVTPAAVALIV